MTAFPFSRVYDHSLPHSQLATGDMEGEWRTQINFLSLFVYLFSTLLLCVCSDHKNVIDQTLISFLFSSASHY
ncbi:unnamed protein product [Spirodela intermedia]|uniref:Uncharacterized protein n=1 Tax=Spirodela intermedia TaxID=51605 RepID=A0A7I8KRB4_SPIIN|nr:unnamed protein product [Spirodela intermedia]